VVDRVADHAFWAHERGVVAVVALGAEAEILAAVAEIQALLGHAATVVAFPVARVAKYALMARAAGPTKGTAVEWLARHHGCAVADVVAVGDWINDVPMFRVAGRSFVMNQAPAAVKACATDELAADVSEGGGIAEAIRRAWGI